MKYFFLSFATITILSCQAFYKPSVKSVKKVVLIAGDQEYRAEQTLEQLNRILNTHHKKYIKSELLYTRSDKNKYYNPYINNIPNLKTIKNADLVVIFCRFLDLPNKQMEIIDNYLKKGGAILGIRTSTHAFNIKSKKKTWHKYHYRSKVKGWKGGFGEVFLGETWINHHGVHNKEATRGQILKPKHPIVRGVKGKDIFGISDVYGIRKGSQASMTPIVAGLVLSSLSPNSKLVKKKNTPPMPIVWIKKYTHPESKKEGIALTSTIGAATDFKATGVRKVIVNGIYWLLGLDKKIPSRGAKVKIVGKFKGEKFKFHNKRFWDKSKVILK